MASEVASKTNDIIQVAVQQHSSLTQQKVKKRAAGA